MDRVRAQEESHGRGFLAWPGFLLVAAPVTASLAGLVQGPVTAGFAYALLVLGVGFIVAATLPPRPIARVEAEEDRAVVNEDEAVPDREAGESLVAFLGWCGYLLVAAPVAAGWHGFADEPVPALLAYLLLLLGVGFIGAAMLAPAKLKTD